MQANLKPTSQKYPNFLLTVSKIQPNGQAQQNEQSKQPNYLFNSNITHSRMTSTDRVIGNQHLIEDIQMQKYNIDQCPTCCIWKRWAVEQQIKLLQLQEAIIQKENALNRVVHQLKLGLQEKNKTILLYNEELDNYKKEIAKLNSQIMQIHNKSLIQVKEVNQNPTATFITPLKNNNSHRIGNSVKMSQLLTDDKKGSTAATKPHLQWSAFQTNLQRFKPNKDEEINKCLFENKMLKEYNSVLLQRLKESKYRRPF